MKRNIKILTVLLSVALLVCGFVFSAIVTGAAEGEYDSGFTYTATETVGNVTTDVVKNEESDLGKVLTEVKANTTIKMNADVTYDVGPDHGENSLATVNSAKGKLTLDLGGNTLTVIQRAKAQSILVTWDFTVKNGTIKVLWADEANKNADTNLYPDKSFPLFQVYASDAKLTLDNVNTYGGTMFYAPTKAEDVKITINGGTHYTMYGFTDVSGGFVESRTSMIFKAQNATFYVAKGRPFISSLSYVAIREGLNKIKSTFRFDNCDIIAEDISQNLITYANEHTTITFNGSRIFGSLGKVNSKTSEIEIGLGSFDVSEPPKYGETLNTIGEGQIILGPGTRYATSETVGETTKSAYFADGNAYGGYQSATAIVVPATQDAIKDNASTYNYTLKLSPSALWYVDEETGEVKYNYDLEEDTVTINYDKLVVVPAYEVIGANGESTVYNYGVESFYDVVSKACLDPGSKVKLLHNIEIEAIGNEKIAIINAGITIDLNGYTLSVFQVPTTDALNAQSTIRLATNEKVVITDTSDEKSGALGVKRDGANLAYPLFLSENGNKLDVTFKDIRFYGSSLIYLYNGLNSQITIEGGEYHSIYTHVGSIGGLVQAVCDVDMVINDAVINIGEKGRLMGSAGRNVSKTEAGSTYTFNRCTIVADVATRNIIVSSNQFTRIAFNECNIFGSFAPAITKDFDTSVNNAFGGDIKGPLPHSITFDAKTYFSSSASYPDDIVSPEVGVFATADSLTGDKTVTLNINELLGDANYYGFADTNEVTRTYIFDMTVDPHMFLITDGTEVDNSAVDFADAIAKAKELSDDGTTPVVITFLGDYTITNGYRGITTPTTDSEYVIATIDFPLTIDLDGRSFNFVQGYLDDNSQETIKVSSTFVVKNGTISAINKDGGKSYPVFSLNSGKYDITLDNITSYTGSIFYSYGASGVFTIRGGEHHIPYATHGNWAGSWFEVHTSIVFTAEDTSFHIGKSVGNYLLSAISNSTRLPMSFTFDNCDVIAEDIGRNLVRVANDLTSIAFNNCRIRGTFEPQLFGDINTTSANLIYNGSPIEKITFGVGTVFNGSATDGLIAVPKGTLLKDVASDAVVSLNVTPTPTISKENITVNGATVEGGFIVISPARQDLKYSFTKAVLDAVIVEIKDKDGAVISETTILPGEAVGTLPTLEASVEETGYVKVTYTGRWIDASGNVITASSIVGAADMNIYPEVTVTPYLKDAMLNLELMGHIKPKLLLPLTTLPDNVKIVAVNLATSGVKGNAMSGSKVTFDGTDYTAYSFNAVGATDIATEYQVIVTYTVDVCGRTETLEQTISKISALKYINNVLSQYVVSQTNPTPKDPDASSALVANMLRYSYYVCRLNGLIVDNAGVSSAVNDNAKYTGIASSYDLYKSLTTEFREDYFELPNPLANAETVLGEYIDWVEFDIETYQPKFKVKFRYNEGEGAFNVIDVKYEIVEGFKPSTSGSDINWGQNLSLIINPTWGESFYTADGKPVYNGNLVQEDSWAYIGGTGTPGQYIHISCPDNLPAYNIIRNIRITLTVSDGTTEKTVSGVYNLRAYYDSVVNSTEIAEEDKPLVYETLYAIHSYSETVASYRFGPAKDTHGWVSYDRANGYGELNAD